MLSGEVQQGQEVVTAMVTGLEPKTGDPGQNNANNPLMGPQRGGPRRRRRRPGGGGEPVAVEGQSVVVAVDARVLSQRHRPPTRR